ncbi:hypothetical protein [Novosphingopyxis sp.]|uniref:hypothetical protein n=1 Tax=Novosphingopyxis sp. TaxID=2709690 RepID=UPI003B5B825B
MAEVQRQVREAQRKLSSKIRHSLWHNTILSYQLREVGFDGEDGEALYYLKQLDPLTYFEQIKAVIDPSQSLTIVELEYKAVKANHDEWTKSGKRIHFEQERAQYLADCESFRQWEAENPSERSWREKPATRRQYFLIMRTAEKLEVEKPVRLKCGEAHDWLAEHGANLRLQSEASIKHSDDHEGDSDG